MAFCTSCGTKLVEGTKFCTGCGAPQSVASEPATPATVASAAAPAPAAAAPLPAESGGGVLKIILILLAVIVGLVIIVGGAATYYITKRVHQIRVEQSGDNATVKTPWGTVSSNADPGKVAEDIGVDVYPGATMLKEGASSVNFGGMSVATANFESSDSIDQVEKFYKARFPKSNISVADENSRTMVMTTNKGMVTLVLKNEDGKTRIEISRTSGLDSKQNDKERETQ